jgi:predicted nucleic acid-binding protein
MREHVRYLEALAAGEVVTAAPVLEELIYGVSRRARGGSSGRRWRAALAWMTGQLDGGAIAVLPYTDTAAMLAGQIRARLPGAGLQGDIRIAACAWVDDRPVLTGNARDFRRIAEAVQRLGLGRPLRIEA